MARRNYFEILGLDFDPPEKNERKIEQAISAWKKRTENILANETNASRRSALSDELDLYSDMTEVLGQNKTRNQEARALKEQRIKQLEQLIDIMRVGESGTPVVTPAQIRNVHTKLLLSPKSVEDTYVKKGFTILKLTAGVDLKETFTSSTVAANISGKISQLNTMTIAKFPWTSKVKNLFDLACYFSGGSDADLESFRRKRTTELYSVMESGAAMFASDMSDQGHLMADLFNPGMTQIFDSEEDRKKYERTLKKESLKDFFALLKTAPDIFKHDRYFAESCIRTIQKQFSDYNLALALYNQEAGLLQDPYEQIEALIHVTCAACKTPAEFRTKEEAQNSRCAVCGAELYVKCPNPKCGLKVPASADWCSCGFHISEMQFFDEYYNAAEFALKEMNLTEARRQLQNAENAHPGHPKLITLRNRIEEDGKKYQKPLDELQNLISAGNFVKAQNRLNSIAVTMPQLKVDDQRKEIAEKLSEAKRMMPQAGMPAREKGNRYYEILQFVKDYQPAIDGLALIRPGPPTGLQGSIGGEPLTCSLTWNASGDKGVAYQIVRKKGGIPQRQTDGEILISDHRALEYRDQSPEPGIDYGYAVFACRMGVYSEPSVCRAQSFSELDKTKMSAMAENGICRFSWVLPTNCVGVRILRCTKGIPGVVPSTGTLVLSEHAAAAFEDKTVANNVTYGYRLQCVYPYENGFKYSEGQTMMLTPEPPPLALKNIAVNTEGQMVQIRWTSPDHIQRPVSIREVNEKTVLGVIGQVLPASELNALLGNGRIYASTTSTAQVCQFMIPSNTAHSLALVTVTGSRGIVSGIVPVSSIVKCEINKKETRIEGGRLKILLQHLPENLVRIHYTVAQKVDARVPWATPADAKNHHLSSVTVQEYLQDGMIAVEPLPKTDLYISVIGQYKMPNGTIVYSEASKQRISNKPKDRITYCFSWGTSLTGKPRPKNARLLISSDAAETPEMKLVYRSDGHIPMQATDPRNVVLLVVPAQDDGYSGGQYVHRFSDEVWQRMCPNTELRLMMDDNDAVDYEIMPSDVKTLKVPQ